MRQPALASARRAVLALSLLMAAAGCSGPEPSTEASTSPFERPMAAGVPATERDLGPGSPSYQAGLEQLRAGHLSEAAAAFREAIAEDSSDPRPFNNLATISLRGGDWTAARSVALAGLEAHPEDWKLRLNLGIALQQLGRSAQAQEELERALAAGGERPETWYWLGVAHYSQAFVVLGASSIDHERLDQAIAALEKAAAGDPERASYQRQLGVAWKDKHELDRAAPVLARATELAPDDAEGWSLLGTVESRRGRGAEARAALRRAIELDPERAGARAQLGMLEAREGHDEAAVQSLERSLSLDDSVADVWYQLSLALRRLGRDEEAKAAIARFESTKKLRDDLREQMRKRMAAPNDANAHYNVGVAQAALGQVKEARRSYEHALQLDEELAPAHENLAEILMSEGEAQKAAEHLKRALELDPDDASAHVNLGRLALAIGQPDQALAPLARAASLEPSHAMPHFFTGMAQLQLGSLDAARLSFEKAVELDPEDLLSRYNLGGCYFEQGALDEADEQFRAILERSPDHAQAKAALSAVAQKRASR